MASIRNTTELHKLHRMAQDEAVEGEARCLTAVPVSSGRKSLLLPGEMSFRVCEDMLTLTQGDARAEVPIATIEAVSLEQAFEQNDPDHVRVFLDVSFNGSLRRIALGGSGAAWARDYGVLVTALARQGVTRFNAVSAGVLHDISGRLRFGPVPGGLVVKYEPGATYLPTSGIAAWGLRWYQKERSPRVVRKYDDNWLSRRDMRKDIRESAKYGWSPEQTQATPGHVNVGTLLIFLITLPTIIIPLLLLGSLRSSGGFVVTFGKVSRTVPASLTYVPSERVSPPTANETLRELANLREDGLITQEDYDEAKQRILADLTR